MKTIRKILDIPTIREMTKNSGEYTANTRREIEFSACQTKDGVRVTSRSFGDSRGARVPENKCQREFGNSAKEIAHIHSHPPTNRDPQTLDNTRFSHGDMFAYISDSIEKPGKIYCVAQKIKRGKKENIRVRCTNSETMYKLSDRIGYNPNKDFLMTPRKGKLFDRINESSFCEDL